jgi:glucose/arabinose dehydrogenase/PKD repeat protein
LATSAPLAFETLESRLLLAADPLGIAAGYAFNETSGTTAADASGHNITGTLTNGPTFTAGKYGNAVSLDGANDYVSLGNPTSLQLTGSMTLSAWVNVSAFPADDAAIISKRAAGELGFQLDLTKDTGPRTIGLKLTSASGEQMFRYGATTLQANTWYHVAGVYNAATQQMDVYLNGVLDNGTQVGTVTSSQQNSNSNVTIGRRAGAAGYEFAGRIDDARIANHALTQSQIQTDMATPLVRDTVAPSAPTGLKATPASPTQINLSWTASTDNVGVTGYQVFRNGTLIATTTTNSYSNTGLTPNTSYSYSTKALDAAGNVSASSGAVSATTPGGDATAPTVSLTAPTGSTVSGTVTVSATASDNVGVSGVQFLLDGANLGAEDATSPYSISWNTTNVSNGSHTLNARARDAAGNSALSAPLTVNVSNAQVTGIVAGYAFNETSGTTTADASGHNITGTLTNGPSFTAGKYGNAVSLDGVNDYVNLGNPTALQLTGSMTLSAWVNASAFPVDDAAIISKRAAGESGFQLDLTKDTGPRTIGFKLTSGSGGQMFRYGATTLQPNTWYHVAGVYNAATQSIDVYLNGVLDNGALVGTVTGTQQNSSSNVTIGRRAGTTGYEFAGRIDDVRIDNEALTQGQIQTDMATPLGLPQDTIKPQVQITAPAPGTQVNGIVTVTANASDNVGIGGVQFFVDGVATGPEDTAAGYALAWDTRTVGNGTHTLSALARDLTGNTTLSSPVSVTVSNTSQFRNEVLATGFDLPTAIKFMPDGRMLVVQLAGTIKVLPAPYTTPSATPFLQLTNVGSAGVQQGVYDIALDPSFSTNHFYYIFYTAGTPNRDRLSRFTANSSLTGTVAGSEKILYQDPEDADAEHHGGAINFGNDGKIYLTTGEHFRAGEAQDLATPRGKILRFNPDGTIPTDNPFYDGTGPNYDAVWAFGLRNPYRAYYDAPTGRLIVGDVGGNDYSTAIEEVDIGARGANYGWPNVEAPNGNPSYTAPAYYYPHNGRDAAITGGFVYHGDQFPNSYKGSYFFADYTQNWIRRLTFDSSGKVSGVFNFEPADGSVDGPYGDIVYLTEGPEGALYYLDLGYSDISGTFGVSKIRRISFLETNQPPVAAASATPTQGAPPLTVNFSSTGSSDPEGHALTYRWTLGDGATSTAANPTHTYQAAGSYEARLTVSDGVNSTLSTPITISVGNAPNATILTPAADAPLFKAGDVISFSGDATDIEDGSLPASAYTWNIDFLHEGHVHPGTPITGVKSGTFTIPTSGHDFSGFTRYRITLTVKDSSGLESSKSVTIFPDKVNLNFSTVPDGLTLYLDGIAHTGPFVYDTLIGFNHVIEARNQTIGSTAYNFASWSDGGAQQHTIVVPSGGKSLTARYNAVSTPAFVQVNAATPQTNQSQVRVTYANPQQAGHTNILAIGWNNATSNLASVTDSAGNVYHAAAGTTRGTALSQAIYYATNIKASAGGANIVTVTFNTAAPFVDIRAMEYSGLDPVNPVDATRSAVGTSASAASGAIPTTSASDLIFAAGMTNGGFSAPGGGFTSRIITRPNLDIAEDRLVTSIGSYNATASLVNSAAWVMQVVAFRAANQTVT